MSFLYRLNLDLRKFLWRAYPLFASIVAKTGITKICFRNKSLGQRINLLFNQVLNFKAPEPIETNGMAMYHRSSDGRGWFGWAYAFDFEPETRSIFEQLVKQGMTVVDAGANIGYYTLLAAKLVGNNGKVYAFEPDPAYYALLKKNIEINGLSTIAEPFRLAVGNTEGRAVLFLGRSTSSSLLKLPDADITGQTVMVDLISLDNFFAKHNWPAIDVIKMDVEGAEMLALEGMKELAKRNPGLKLFIEFNPFYLKIAGTSVQDWVALLNKLGFNQIQLLSGNGRIYKISQETDYLISLLKKSKCLNLLCEKNFNQIPYD